DPFQRNYGKTMYEVLPDHPELSGPFNRAMTQTVRMSAEWVANFGDFQRFTTVADLGGGQGRLIGEIVRKNPGLRGMVLDFPHVVKGAPDLLASLGVADRVTVVPGDFRDGLPAGADAYIFHRVLGAWEDHQIAAALRRVHSEIVDQPHARLIIAEPFTAPPNRFHPGRLFDIEVMLNSGSRLRAEAEWMALLAAAGFEFVSTHEACPMVTMLEVRPVVSS
ncbi:MAG: methyltransferase, partial [Mycobacteriales bacterium]